MPQGFRTARGEIHRQTQAPTRARRQGRLGGLGRLQDPATEPPGACQAVDPCDGIGRRAARLLEGLEESLQVGDAPFPYHDGIGRHAPEREAHGQDHAGQAQSADRRVEPLALSLRAEARHLSARQQEVDPAHLVAEAAMAIVVLPMDVVRDRTADGGVAGARAHRGDETARQEVSQQIVERHPGLAHDLAAVGVEGQDAVQARCQDHPPAAVERGVAVAAAAGMADEAVVIAGVPQGVDEGFPAVRGAGERRGPGQAPEAAEIYGLPIHSEGRSF